MVLTEQRIKELEQLKMELFYQIHLEALEEPPLYCDNSFLYHGIRKETLKEQLEVLRSILEKGLLLGDQVESYHPYSDNCNQRKRISLLEKIGDGELEFETFVKPKIALLVSPQIVAYKTIYVPYQEWLEISAQTGLHNFYSYARNEYQSELPIPAGMIRAIGVPYNYLEIATYENPKAYLKEVISLLKSLGIDKPIVDHSSFNQYIYKK